MRYISTYHSPLGEMLLASEDGQLTGAWFAGQKYFGRTLHGDEEEGEDEAIRMAKTWLDAYFRGEQPRCLPKMHTEGSPLRETVTDIMLGIPYGETMTYGQIAREAAKRLGKASMSAQAVGGAVGHNPISVLIPCHRVVGADGSLTGYAGGLERKIALLKLEKQSATI